MKMKDIAFNNSTAFVIMVYLKSFHSKISGGIVRQGFFLLNLKILLLKKIPLWDGSKSKTTLKLNIQLEAFF